MSSDTISCSRRIQFCYGHRLKDHEGECANLHGHNGVVWIHAITKTELDHVGRVVDFAHLKNEVGNWIETNWDHNMILNKEDQDTIQLLKKFPQKKEYFELPYNPTAENLAKYLLLEVCPKLLNKYGIIVHKIEFFETENCKAEATINPNDERIKKLYL